MCLHICRYAEEECYNIDDGGFQVLLDQDGFNGVCTLKEKYLCQVVKLMMRHITLAVQ